MERGVSPNGRAPSIAPGDTTPLDLYWNNDINDHMLVATAGGKEDAKRKNYSLIRSVGLVFKNEQEGLVPLNQMWSTLYQDHALVAGKVEMKGYVLVRTEGWVYKVKEVVTGSLPLTTYWSERRKDTVSVADTGTSEMILKTGCYVLRRIEARILPFSSVSPPRTVTFRQEIPPDCRSLRPTRSPRAKLDPSAVTDTPNGTHGPNYDSATMRVLSGLKPEEIKIFEGAVVNIQRIFRGHSARRKFHSLQTGWDDVVDKAIDKRDYENVKQKIVTLESVNAGLDLLLNTMGAKPSELVQVRTLATAVVSKYNEMLDEIRKQREQDRQRLAKVKELVAEGDKKPPRLKQFVDKVSNGLLRAVGLKQERDLDEGLDSQQTAWETEPVFTKIVQEDLEGLKDVIRKDSSKKKARDHFGATPLLVCMLLNGPKQKEMARWLLQRDPSLAGDTYTTDAFNGELALHFAVLARDIEMTETLCKAYPKCIEARATGLFFRGGDNGVYFGESPLMFAITSNQPDMVLLLLEYAEKHLGKTRKEMLDERNLDGNTILHMCVWHNLPEMYKFLEAMCKEHNPTFYESGLTTCVNNAKLTPFTLAAEMGHVEIFTHLLETNTLTRWNFGPASYRAVFIDEIETNDGRPSILDLLVENQHQDLLALPLIRNFLLQKWNAYVKKIFLKRIFMVSTFVLLFMIAGVKEKRTQSHPCAAPYSAIFENVLENPLDSLQYVKEYLSCEGRVLMGLGPVALVERMADLGVFLGAFYKGKREFGELSEQGFAGYFGVKGSMLLENILSSCCCFVTLLSYVCRFLGSSLEDLFAASAALLLWAYVLWLMLGFKQTGPFIIMIWKMLSNDMLQFFVIFVTFQLGFTQAFHLIMETDPDSNQAFFSQLRMSFEVILGEVDLDTEKSEFPNVAYLLKAVYVVLVASILMNLLVAMMSTTYEEIRGEADVIWNMEFSRMILSLESELSLEEKGVKWWTVVDGRRAFMLPMFSEETRAAYSNYNPDWDAIPLDKRPRLYEPSLKSPAMLPAEAMHLTPKVRPISL